MPKLPFAFVLLALANPLYAADAPIYQRIDFQTEVDKEISNDLLTATLSIELNNKNPALLAKELTTITNDALKMGTAYNNVKLTSGNQQTYPIYNEKNKLEGWRGRAEIMVTSKDFKAAGELISQLQSKLQLNNLNFSVAPETRRSAENQLISEAVAAFRARADSIKTAWNAKGYKLVQMNLGTSNNQAPQPMYMMRTAKMDMMEAAPAADYAGGQSRLNVQVSGSIELEN
ncbi:MAG: SIMPL domain-containing protein [Agitococcus sp.]